MPGADQIEAIERNTMQRDLQLSRMTDGIGGPSISRLRDVISAKATEIKHKLDEGKAVSLTAGEGVVLARFEPGQGAVLAACCRARARDTFGLVERALMPFTTIGVWGVSPGDRWRDAEHFRPFYAVAAVTSAVNSRPIGARELEAACAVLPGVPAEQVQLALKAARDARAVDDDHDHSEP